MPAWFHQPRPAGTNRSQTAGEKGREMLRIALAILACYYWSFVITKLAGPFKAFRWLRAKVKSDLVACPHCIGFHMALIASLWLYRFDSYALWELPLIWFGIAGGSSVLHSFDRSE